jgi:hypothetical protein
MAWMANESGFISWLSRDLPLLWSIWTGSGSHLALYPVDIRGSSLGLKQLVYESDHPPPSSTELKNTRIYSLCSPSYFDSIVLNYLSTRIDSAVNFNCWEQFQQFWTLCSHHLDKEESGNSLICRYCGGGKRGLCVELSAVGWERAM